MEERKCPLHKRGSKTCTTCRQILLNKQNAERRKAEESGERGYKQPIRPYVGD